VNQIRTLAQLRSFLFTSPVPALLLPFIAWQIGTQQGWTACLGLLAALSALGWFHNERHRRAIANTPTSRIASAPQGYIELIGQARYAGDPVYSPGSCLPCVWYRCVTERADADNQNNYQHVSTEESDASFLLNDGSGEVLILTDGAQIEVQQRAVTHRDGYRHTEWLIQQGQPLFVLGDFVSQRNDGNLDFRRDVSLRLAEMKQDRQTLLEHFDQNGDGQIDLKEWDAVRSSVQAQVAAELRDEQARPATHTLRRPSSSRLPFIITTRPPDRQLQRYRIWRWLQLMALVTSLQGIWLIQHNPAWLGL